jgi:hypothetical protein
MAVWDGLRTPKAAGQEQNLDKIQPQIKAGNRKTSLNWKTKLKQK